MNQIIVLGKTVNISQLDNKDLIITLSTTTDTDEDTYIKFLVEVENTDTKKLLNSLKLAKMLAVKLQFLHKPLDEVIFVAQKMSILESEDKTNDIKN
jgi:hypothetical protein